MPSSRSAHATLPEWAWTSLELLRWGAASRFSPEFSPSLSTTQCAEALRERGIDSLLYWASDTGSRQQHLYDLILVRQLDALHEVLNVFAEEHIPALVFKGAAFAHRWRPSSALGMMVDCDLLVPRSMIEDARAIMYTLGYRHGAYDPAIGRLIHHDVLEVARSEAVHYELSPFNRSLDVTAVVPTETLSHAFDRMPLWTHSGRATLILEFDIHHGVASDLDAAIFFEDRDFSPGQVVTFSDTDHFWFGCARYYAEVALHERRSLRELAYLAPLAKYGQINWSALVARTKSTQTAPALYHMLSFFDFLAPGNIPADVFDELNPLTNVRYRDWGAITPQLFGFVDPLSSRPEAFFQFARP